MAIFSMILSLLCGVSLFLFGMSLMGDGLKLAAGNKLEAFLYKVFSDYESFYEFMNCPYDPPQVDINDLVYFYEHYYYNNAAQVYEMSQGEMKYEL